MANQPSRRRFTPVQWVITILLIALVWFVLTRLTPQSAAPASEPAAATATVQPTAVADAAATAPPDDPAEDSAAQPSDATPTTQPTAASLCNTEQVSDLPAIAYDDLPPEAQETLVLIEAGGPFPYDKDGSTFQNREEILPPENRGYYREYTVVTPGESDRGARRLVGGEVDELYYTDDHYASFSEVLCP